MNISVELVKKSISKRSILWKAIVSYKYFYLLLLLPMLYYIIFAYLPMYGVTLAFKQFRYDKGLFNSPWVGMQNVSMLINDQDFISAFKNTLTISLTKIMVCFPIPIILSLLLNEITKSKLKRIYQTIFTFPHFMSWVVVSGIVINLLSDKGTLNQLINLTGTNFSPLTDSGIFRWVLYFSHSWKEMGWDCIIYLAALAGINPEMYEAANIDGARRLQLIRYITWPGISGTVAVMLILAIGMSMTGNFDQIFNMYNPSVYKVADIIDTYVYRQAFTLSSDFSYAAAVGLFKSVVSLILVITANNVTKRLFKEEGLV